MHAAPTYVFDGHCVLCSRGVAYILKHEKQPDTRFVTILSEEGRQLAKAHGIDPQNPYSFLYIVNGKTYEKSDAVLALIKHTGGPARILLIGYMLPKPIRDGLYRLVARNRYRIFGQTQSCYVPTPETKDRFVLE